ncbi:DUF6318 family protein [Aeromicrobium sp. 9AM]|uniref:DUF6318 family protein n=1 Tax=Aeromicrobium sp. 9AM TaxID=2653126 RepID=UPI0012F2A41C|nr:DUF6318 family protein [Aeromicrobium sp. 9AM]VXB37545.1 conserved exported hypothetical protein [Aeromicrobium sp. 9AM]
MRFGGIVLAVLLTLGACSSDPAPKEPKRTSTSASPTATPPTMPAQAKEDTSEGAAAFVKHYIDVFNYAASTGDVEELSRLSSPKCEGCQSYINLYRDTYKSGGYFKGGKWTASKFTLETGDSETYATTTITSGRNRFRTSRDDNEQTSSSEKIELTFAIQGTSGSRRITQLALGDAK